MVRRRQKSRGIFCLEGDWWNDLKRPSSVRPLLEPLRHLKPYPPYIHRGIGTREEFEFYLHKWSQRTHSDFPILWLAFHGTPETIHVGDQRGRKGSVTLDDIAETIAGRCTRRIIHFGGCETLQCNGHRLNRFLKRPGAIAVSGYENDIDWIQSAAFLNCSSWMPC